MPPRQTRALAAAAARAIPRTRTPPGKLESPNTKPPPVKIEEHSGSSSGSESPLTEPPSDTDDDESKYFRRSVKTETPVEREMGVEKGRGKGKWRVKTEPVDEDDEPAPSMGDIPALPLPPAPAMVKKEPGRRFKKEPASDIKKEPAKRIKKELPVRIKSEAGIKSEASIKSEVPDATPLPGPENWERIYALVKRMRLSHPAPVDTMGCERLADATHSPKDQRFQTLIALMLSSQTKDTVTSAVIQTLQAQLPGGLTLNSILSIPAAELNTLIHPVGFHTRKTGYIQAAAAILRDQHGGDIPDSVDGLMALPGVGPKMAHLCMGAAWDTVTGVGVDVHVHRIANMWGWATAKDPEGTRVQLEKWLPRDKWREINWLLVGFGQSICLPRGRRCGECELGVGEGKGLCRAAFMGNADGTGVGGAGAKGKARTKAVKRVVKDEEESSGDDGGAQGDSGEDYKPAKQKRRVRRKVVKEEVPIDGGDVGGGDIEDCLK